MKIIPILLSAMLASGCVRADEQPRAPVNIAMSLYNGCMTGFFKSGEFPTTKQAILARVEDLDVTCVAWATAWYPPMVGDTKFRMTADELQRLEERHQASKQEVIDTLKKFAGVK